MIAVAIPPLDKLAVFVPEALAGWVRGFEVHRSGVPHRRPRPIAPLPVAFGNRGLELISGLEEIDRVRPHEATSQEAHPQKLFRVSSSG